MGRKNPHNPYSMVAEFQLNIVDDSQFMKIKENMKEKFNVKLDDMMAVEGCINDDKTILGGKAAFMSHFCTFFSFNACYSAAESHVTKNVSKLMADGEAMDNKLDQLLRSMDEGSGATK